MQGVEYRETRDKYLEDLIERIKVATDDFSHDAEVHIPKWEVEQFDIETRTISLAGSLGHEMSIIVGVNEDGSKRLICKKFIKE